MKIIIIEAVKFIAKQVVKFVVKNKDNIKSFINKKLDLIFNVAEGYAT